MDKILNNRIIGFHTSKNGLTKFNCPLQFFVGPPFGYETTPLLNEDLSGKIIFVHSKYVGNIAKHKSTVTIRNLKSELLYLQNLKIKHCGSVFHLSTGYDENSTESLKYIASVLNKFCKDLDIILDNNYYNYIIIETSNNINHLGSKIEDLKILYDNLDSIAKQRIRFCIDTSHIFVTFYNIDTVKGIVDYFCKFDYLIGLNKIILIHLNDSKGYPLSSYKPHEEIGKGNIFKNRSESINTLNIIKTISELYKIPNILERKVVEDINNDLLKEMKTFLNMPSIDLNNFMGMFNKRKIMLVLNELYELYAIFDNTKSRAYLKARDSISENKIVPLKYELINQKISLVSNRKEVIEKYKKIPYIGESISNKIYELISQNRVIKIEQLKSDPSYKFLSNLTSLISIGPKIAKKLIDLKITNFDDIIKNQNEIISNGILSENKIESIALLKDICPKSRKYIDDLKNKIKISGEWYILGSYSRGCLVSNDIDILIIDTNISDVLDALKKYKFSLINILRKGEKIFSGIFEKNEKKILIEINKVNAEEKYSAILHFTGSKEFNIFMRNRAKDKNMKLNQYGLFDSNGQRISINSEKDIFRILDIEFIHPNKRNL